MTDQTPVPSAEAPANSVPPRDEFPIETRAVWDESPELAKVLGDLGISLLISTYQAAKLIVARNKEGALDAQFRHIPKPMGIAVGKNQFAVGATGEIVFFQDVPTNCERLESPGKRDACFVQRYAHLTGDIDVHEMAFDAEGRIWFINTAFSALCTIDGTPSFVPVWRPSFVSDYQAGDRCHLNGLGMRNGRPRYVTALGESDTPRGWRENKANGGVLIDLVTGETICRGLSMPHSPRWYADHLWVCESGKGELSRVDLDTGKLKPMFQFPGFTRGLDFCGPLAFVGLSQIRETAMFSGIPIVAERPERNCGVWVVNIVDGSLVGVLRFSEGVHEIFAVQALQGKRFPEVLDKYDKVALETYFLPPHLAKTPSPGAVPASAG
jgi:uncharacterized protein (TIGR03032 family)